MQIVRTIAWTILAAYIFLLVFINWGQPQRVKIWLTANDAIGFDWPVGAIAFVFLLCGALPMWLYHRSVKWSLQRRIRSLENSIKSNALSRRHEPHHEEAATSAPSPAAPSQAVPPKSVDSEIASGDTLTPTGRDKASGNPSE